MQIYVVMGGYYDEYNPHASAEQFSLEWYGKWRTFKALPRPLSGLRAITMDNIIYVTGQMTVLMIRDKFSLLCVISSTL